MITIGRKLALFSALALVPATRSPLLAQTKAPVVRSGFSASTNSWVMSDLVAAPSHAAAVLTPSMVVRDGQRPGDWTFAANVRVHPETTGANEWPDIGVFPDGTVGVAWMADVGGFHIFCSFSTDDGQSWSTPEQVDTRQTGAFCRLVSLESTPLGTPVVVWEDDREGVWNVYLSKRDPTGFPWTPEVRVNTTGGTSNGWNRMRPSIAVLDEDRFFVAWTDWREGFFGQVYMRATQDGGLTWTTERRISDGTGVDPEAADPCLIVDPASASEPGAEVLYCLTNDWSGASRTCSSMDRAMAARHGPLGFA
jgi:hypothetical protein